MLTFLSFIPVWVPFLFVLLLFVGFRAARRRTVPIALIAALPLLGLLTLRNLLALDPAPWLWAMAAAVYAGGISMGATWQRGWIVSRQGRCVTVQGEWVTMTAVMTLFVAGFVQGALSVIAPDVTETAVYLAAYTSMICFAAGQFLGRAIITLRPVRPAAV